MMFMMPMPPTSSEMDAMPASLARHDVGRLAGVAAISAME
jgi:hypothetical protein